MSIVGGVVAAPSGYVILNAADGLGGLIDVECAIREAGSLTARPDQIDSS